MAADATIDLIINQKDSFEVSFNVIDNGAPLDLSNYTVASKYKLDISSPDSSAKPFTASIANAVAGTITIALTPTQTAALDLSRYYYDVAITENTSGFKTRVVEGRIKVSGGVT